MATGTADSVYQELKTELTDLKGFLDTETPKIKPVYGTLRSLIPQIDDLLDKLISLMGDIKTAITALQKAITTLPILSDITTLTQKITAFLQTVITVVPSQSDAINTVLGIAKGIGDLPQQGQQIFTDINGLLDDIAKNLLSLKTPS
jgi:hypothetical protein